MCQKGWHLGLQHDLLLVIAALGGADGPRLQYLCECVQRHGVVPRPSTTSAWTRSGCRPRVVATFTLGAHPCQCQIKLRVSINANGVDWAKVIDAVYRDRPTDGHGGSRRQRRLRHRRRRTTPLCERQPRPIRRLRRATKTPTPTATATSTPTATATETPTKHRDIGPGANGYATVKHIACPSNRLLRVLSMERRRTHQREWYAEGNVYASKWHRRLSCEHAT